VRAAPPWHRSPHTLYIRQAIRALEKRRALHLTGQCDAIDELIRYAEGSNGKRLPPHPAYLEARRVLQQHAQALSGHPAVAQAGQTPAPPTTETKQQTRLPGEPETPRRPLPPMQMAKTW
jgi:hypothetical protein